MRSIGTAFVTSIVAVAVACGPKPPPRSVPTPPTAATTESPPPEPDAAESPVAARVREVIAARFEVDAAQVTPTASFANELGADSLSQVELVLALEEDFNIEIADEDWCGVDTLAQAVVVVEAQLK